MDLQKLANVVGDELFEAHRGVVHLKDGNFLIFGNDGFAQDKRAKREVERIRQALTGQAEEIGFATSEGDTYTWVVVVRKGDLLTEAGKTAFASLLVLVLWTGYRGQPLPKAGESTEELSRRIRGDGFESLQTSTAENDITKALSMLHGMLAP
jgi:hypothetical protein